MGLFNATATYGRGLKETEVADRFVLRIYTGGFAFGGTADKRAAEELEKHRAELGYAAYEVVARKRKWIPSCFDYTVQFRRT
jgi:hypothetical protein